MTGSTVIEECLEVITNYYEGGKGLKGKSLKNYTSGDHGQEGLETIVDNIIRKVAAHCGVSSDRLKVNDHYFYPPNWQEEDPQRMDHHVWVDNQVRLIVESRAWVDKPFYTLKRAVVRNMMQLDYVQEHCAADLKFAFVGFAIDIKQRLINTLDQTMGHGERIENFKLSPYRRGYQKKNWFDHGVHEEGVKAFVRYLMEIFEPLGVKK